MTCIMFPQKTCDYYTRIKPQPETRVPGRRVFPIFGRDGGSSHLFLGEPVSLTHIHGAFYQSLKQTAGLDIAHILSLHPMKATISLFLVLALLSTASAGPVAYLACMSGVTFLSSWWAGTTTST